MPGPFRFCGGEVDVRVPVTAIALLCFMVGHAVHTSASSFREGVKFYRQKEYEKASSAFTEALVKRPEAAELHYNLGNAAYKMKDYKKAEKSFLTAIARAKDERLKEKAWFNLGNTFFRQGRLVDAIAAYRQALKIDPQDKDAKRNLAFTERLLKKMKRKAQQTAQRMAEKRGTEEKNKKQQQQTSEKQEEKKREEKAGVGRPRQKKRKISREAAEMLLQGMKEHRPQLPKKKRRIRGGTPGVGKNW